MTEAPDWYFSAYERQVTSLEDFEARIAQVDALADRTGKPHYWRGQSRAAWGIHSSLHRAIARKRAVAIHEVTEADVLEHEALIVGEARDWIRPSVGARLTTVDLLARLQHHGAPTRLLDFTTDPLVALFFAVAEDCQADGRVLIAAAQEDLSLPVRESFAVPWVRRGPIRPTGWDASLFALLDQRDFPRIAEQRGVFILGGTPTTRPHRRGPGGQSLTATQVRTSMSVALALHSWAQAEAALAGRRARGPRVTFASALTLRIPAQAKVRIGQHLADRGYTWRRLFPDPAGLVDHSQILGSLQGRGV